jgi:plastocyanin
VTTPGARAAVTAFALLLPLASACAPGRRSGATYVPRGRDVTLTAVPLLTKEMRRVYPFLERDFASGGVLEGREVYAFLPSTVTVVEGDTITFHFVNPEDDAHTFVLGDLAVGLPGQSVTSATWVARRAGIFAFSCNIASHQPSMWGQVIVLAPGAVGGAP